jgi:hypothetical protein
LGRDFNTPSGKAGAGDEGGDAHQRGLDHHF